MGLRDPGDMQPGCKAEKPRGVRSRGSRRSKDRQTPEPWRSTSPTLSYLRDNAARFQQSYDAVKRGLYSKAAGGGWPLWERLDERKNLIRAGWQRLAQRTQSQPQRQDAVATDLQKVVDSLGSPADSRRFTVGTLSFGFLLFVAGHAPWALPWLYCCFFICSFPWRVRDFCRQRWGFFLIDYCYWANALTVLYLVLNPSSPSLRAVVYALADGPLAGALVVWQSAWVFGSASHSVSVLIHMLPGLALFAHRFCPPPAALAASMAAMRSSTALGSLANRLDSMLGDFNGVGFVWLFAAPMAFYASWQLVYFVIVQLCCRQFILRHKYETSYSSLARRAAKTNNVWNRFVRRGSPLRRACAYGLLQLVFTVGCLVLVIPVYHSFWLALTWQVIKVVVPVYYGSRYQCEKVPRYAVSAALKQYRLECNASTTLQPAAAGPARDSS